MGPLLPMTKISVLWLTVPRLSGVLLVPSLLPIDLGVLQVTTSWALPLALLQRFRPC